MPEWWREMLLGVPKRSFGARSNAKGAKVRVYVVHALVDGARCIKTMSVGRNDRGTDRMTDTATTGGP